MEQYIVTGMSCAACSARVEKAVSRVDGVTGCSVNLLTNTMGVEGTASEAEIIAAVEAAGYGARRKSGKRSVEEIGTDGTSASETEQNNSRKKRLTGPAASMDELADITSLLLKKRLLWSLVFLAALMYVSMGHMMWNWPLPEFFSDNPVAVGLLQMLLTAIVMVINQRFFQNGFRGLLHRAPNMDTLVALGAGTAFVYSTAALFAMTKVQAQGNSVAVMHYMHELYFESAAMILTLITVGKLLEARAKGRTTDALRGLLALTPQNATVVREGREIQIPIEYVRKGDIFAVRPGESIPVDGVVLEGKSAVNEAALTGESIPVDKTAGDDVSAATINQSGYLRCEATRVGEDTTLAQIIRLVSDASATKAPIAKIADRVSGIFVPVVIGIALVTFFVWLMVGQSISFALARGISVLVISCPCALGLATPVAIMVGSGVGAKNGILMKSAASLEETGKVGTVVLDKTGTITKGEPEVTDVLVAGDGIQRRELLKMAVSLEQYSEHPLARAVRNYAGKEGIEPEKVSEFQALPGNGLRARLGNKQLYGGNAGFITEQLGEEGIGRELLCQAETLAAQGKTPLFFAVDHRPLGIISVADTMKEDSPQAIAELKGMGIQVVMLTGDNERTAKAIGQKAGVDRVIAGVLPDGKEKVIRQLQTEGRVAMVGDGINDAPALVRADIGIAIGAGSDIAIDSADVVLVRSRLTDVPAAIRLSRGTLRNIKENLFWAFIYNVIGIPLAAGAFISLFGWKLQPMYGAAAMSLSSFFVVTNALRLNLLNLHSPGKDKKTKTKTEGKNMTRTMRIEGMMCGHCEVRVKKCLEALPEVREAVVSHTDGTAVVSLDAAVSDDMLRKTVEDQDYQVIEIR